MKYVFEENNGTIQEMGEYEWYSRIEEQTGLTPVIIDAASNGVIGGIETPYGKYRKVNG